MTKEDLEKKPIKVKGLLIKKTGEIIYSRAGHDMIWDSTGSYAMDGGQTSGYYRTCGDPKDYTSIEFELDHSLKELYDDWNKSEDKLGRISGLEPVKYTVLDNG
jgi:hypothetical protein